MGAEMLERGEPSGMEVFTERMKSKRPWYNRGDGKKLGLLLDGGAMRAATSGGMALAIGNLHLINRAHEKNGGGWAFDAVYGASAGAAAGAYLLSRQAEAISIFWEDINNTRFINHRRLFNLKEGIPMVDIPYLTHKIMKEGAKALKWEEIVDSPIPLHVFVTNAKDCTTIDFHDFKTQEDLLDALHWSCRIPVFAGLPVKVDKDHWYTDGGVNVSGFCLDEAIADGCTHVLILRSGEFGDITQMMRNPIGDVLLQEYPGLAHRMTTMHLRHEQSIKKLKDNPNFDQILPRKISIDFLETNKHRLMHGATEGYNAAMNRFRVAREKH